MRNFLWLALIFSSPALAETPCPPLLNHTVETLAEHQPVNLCTAYRGKVLLVVNTASRCGYTHQYEGLEKLYSDFQGQGLVVLGFPSNDFGNQEPGTEAQVKSFCSLTYDVKFPMFAKSHVRDGIASPFYASLAAASSQSPQWNFHKYLIGRDGRLLQSFRSDIEPDNQKLVAAITEALKEK